MENAHADHDERVRHVRLSWEVHHTVQLSGMCSQFVFPSRVSHFLIFRMHMLTMMTEQGI
jgi:hypothetical protein